jgi:hypothetical protein
MMTHEEEFDMPELENLAFLPTQMETARYKSGAMQLHRALLEDALYVISRYPLAKRPSEKALLSNTIEWVNGAEAKVLFESCCIAAGYDADTLRNALNAYLARADNTEPPLKKMRGALS